MLLLSGVYVFLVVVVLCLFLVLFGDVVVVLSFCRWLFGDAVMVSRRHPLCCCCCWCLVGLVVWTLHCRYGPFLLLVFCVAVVLVLVDVWWCDVDVGTILLLIMTVTFFVVVVTTAHRFGLSVFLSLTFMFRLLNLPSSCEKDVYMQLEKLYALISSGIFNCSLFNCCYRDA